MGWEKGQSGNLQGRKVGSKNKMKKSDIVVTTLMNYIVDGGYEKFKKELNNLKSKDYVNAMIQISKIAISGNEVVANNKLIEMFNNKIKNYDAS